MGYGTDEMWVDDREFQAALTEYMAVTKRELPVVLNKIGADVAFRAYRLSERADAGAIRSLPQRDWWVKLISTRMPVGKLKKKAYQAEARALSRKLIRNRARRVGYLASAFIKAAKALQRKGPGSEYGQSMKGTSGTASPATANQENPRVDLTMQWGLVNAAKHVKVEEKAGKAIAVAMAEKITDMKVYIERKLAEAAARIAARGAR